MTANDNIRTKIVIKSIQSLSMLNFSIACIWPRGRELTGSSHVCHHCIICHVLLQRQPRKSVAMTKGADKGSGRGGCEEGGGMRTCGFETSKQIFFFLLLLSFPITPQKPEPLFLSTPNLL